MSSQRSSSPRLASFLGFSVVVALAAAGVACGSSAGDGGLFDADDAGDTGKGTGSAVDDGTTASSGGTATDGGPRADAAVDEGPVVVQNLSWSVGSGTVDVTFVVQNRGRAPIAELEGVELAFDGDPSLGYGVECARFGRDACGDWQLRPGETSELLELRLRPLRRNDGQTSWSLDLPCDREAGRTFFSIYPAANEVSPRAATSHPGSAGAQDGTPWSYASAGPERT